LYFQIEYDKMALLKLFGLGGDRKSEVVEETFYEI
jgi:hypothetical protein